MDFSAPATSQEIVALRKESVDRNNFCAVSTILRMTVALRKESVDRNSTISATFKRDFVALRKESVDRNRSMPRVYRDATSRSPQGERG